jgi:serine/threonine-protein kinase
MSEELPPAPGRLAVGSLLAGYRCEEEIGRGGMAVVYRARDDHLDRRVALKVLAPDLARDHVFRARFIQESRIAAATEHPNIIPVFNAGEADGVLYIAMRYIPDGDVRALIDRVGPLPAARACALIAQAASALDAAHARGLVHRDVKPTNMLLEVSSRSSLPDHLYLSDFGLAKPSSAATGLTMTGQFFGTVDYVAPEQIQAQHLDGRADQYALACTTFEMLSGSPPFKRDTGMAVISAQLSEPPPPLSALRPDLPAAADRVISKALAKAPADRYERCLDFAEALAAACAQGQPLPGEVPHPLTRTVLPVAPATVADAGTPPGDDSAATPPAGTIFPPAAAGFAAGAAAGSSPPPGAGSSPPPAAGYSPPPAADYPPPSAGGFPPQPPIGFPPPAGGSGFPPPPGQEDPSTLRWWAGEPVPEGPDYRDRPPRRSHAAAAAGVVALIIVLFFGAAGVTYFLLHRTSGSGPSAAGPGTSTAPATATSAAATPTQASPTTTSAAPPGVVATVRSYYAAINHHRYPRAWRLGGRNTGSTYPSFVSGFATTAHDRVMIQSVSGDVVTAEVTAEQTDGTVKTYQGTYTVTGGVITQFNVHQIS